MTTALPPVVAGYLAAVNALDLDAMVAAFAPDAYVNDARREISGIDAIRRCESGGLRRASRERR